jgi:hypothetical protein
MRCRLSPVDAVSRPSSVSEIVDGIFIPPKLVVFLKIFVHYTDVFLTVTLNKLVTEVGPG